MGGRHMGGGLAWGAGEGLRKGEVGEQRWGEEESGRIWVLQGSGGPVQPSGDWGRSTCQGRYAPAVISGHLRTLASVSPALTHSPPYSPNPLTHSRARAFPDGQILKFERAGWLLTKQTVSERQLLELREEMSAHVEQHRLEALRQRWGRERGRGGHRGGGRGGEGGEGDTNLRFKLSCPRFFCCCATISLIPSRPPPPSLPFPC